MVYPISNWKTRRRGYGFGVKTFYSDFHLGLDLLANIGENVVAPTSGKIVSLVNGRQGGLTVWMKMSNGKLVRFMHLSKFMVPNGATVKEGQVIAKTGNTGEASTGPHLHVDVSKNGRLELNNHANFEDPEKTFAEASLKPVDSRYGQSADLPRELAMRANLWLIKQIGRKPTTREVYGLVYGHWPFQVVYKNTAQDQWLYKVKP